MSSLRAWCSQARHKTHLGVFAWTWQKAQGARGLGVCSDTLKGDMDHRDNRGAGLLEVRGARGGGALGLPGHRGLPKHGREKEREHVPHQSRY